MSDGKCKTSVVSHSIVLNAKVEQITIGGRQFQQWVDANLAY